MFKFLKNISLKIKMTIIATVAVIGFSVIILSNFSFFQETNTALKEIRETDLKLVQLATDLQVGLVDLNRLFEAVIAENDADTLDEAVEFATKQRKLIEAVEELRPALKSDVDDLLQSFDDYVNESRIFTNNSLNGTYSQSEMFAAAGLSLKKRQQFESKLRQFGIQINTGFESTMDSIRAHAEAVTKDQFVFGAMLVCLVLGAFFWLFVTINRAMKDVIGLSGEISKGNLAVDINLNKANSTEVKKLFDAMSIMRDRLREQNDESHLRSVRQDQMSAINNALRGELTVSQVLDATLKCLADLLNSLVGAVYLQQGDELVMSSTYAYTHRKGDRSRLQLGESLVGQAALERNIFVIRDLPADYAPVASGLGETLAREVMIVPLMMNNKVLAVMELMSLKGFSQDDVEFITRASEGMAIALNAAISRVKLAEALERSRQQSEALEQQQEELRATNEELEEQAATLRASEESLQQQQEELRVMNEELEERNRLLDRQKDEIEKNNAALEISRKDLEYKARELEMSGRYKTEFLSTMSHELRTPLNSILILSQGLMENKKANLLPKQVEHAKVINSSGRDLLMLINDILDLSKVEEGKLEIVAEATPLTDLSSKLHGQFDAQAENKHIGFKVSIDSALPEDVMVDEHRLSQILRNFISNSLKFTHEGQVDVEFRVPDRPVQTAFGELAPADAIEFRVKDTGIGIPADKLDLIFEAFQQVDGTISRKYGGTGLGLTISRKLAEIMQGSVLVTSEGENRGSCFSLFLPRVYKGETRPSSPAPAMKSVTSSQHNNVRPLLASSDAATSTTSSAPSDFVAAVVDKPVPATNTILVIEDDANFSGVLKNLAEEFGFTAFCAHSVKEAREYLAANKPGSIILDLGLPDVPGEVFLGELKGDAQTRDIPVHVISGRPDVSPSTIAGAQEFIAKPFGRDRLDQLFSDIGSELSSLAGNKVLIIEDDATQQELLKTSFEEKNIGCVLVDSGQAAIDMIKKETFGAIILDLELPDTNGFELVETLSQCTNGNVPIIIYTARDLDKRQDSQLRKYARRIVLKTDKSIARLLNETTLFLHWLQGSDPNMKPGGKEDPESVKINEVEGRKLLLVDDDIRNLYSLSAVLEETGFEIETAGTGIEAIDALNGDENFDLVLMDVMMPEMDGLEAMRHIRADSRFQQLPIIALTAKAMKDDRARCIEAGANDYLSKPVDTNKLKAIVKMWLGQA